MTFSSVLQETTRTDRQRLKYYPWLFSETKHSLQFTSSTCQKNIFYAKSCINSIHWNLTKGTSSLDGCETSLCYRLCFSATTRSQLTKKKAIHNLTISLRQSLNSKHCWHDEIYSRCYCFVSVLAAAGKRSPESIQALRSSSWQFTASCNSLLLAVQQDLAV